MHNENEINPDEYDSNFIKIEKINKISKNVLFVHKYRPRILGT